MNRLISANTIPSKVGIDIGIIMFDPRSVEVSTDNKAIMVVATVSRPDLVLRKSVNKTACQTSSRVRGSLRAKLLSRQVAIKTPSSAATPKERNKPYPYSYIWIDHLHVKQLVDMDA
jgi:hypothetical protein